VRKTFSFEAGEEARELVLSGRMQLGRRQVVHASHKSKGQRDNREYKKKAQGESNDREVPVRISPID
jgi:hypothetical protein